MRGVPIREWDAEGDASSLSNPTALLSQSHGQYFSFMLQLEKGDGEKDVILRVGSVDVLIKWMNSLSEVGFFSHSPLIIYQASKLEYDVASGVWRKGERKRKVNPKAIMKYSSMPEDLHKRAVIFPSRHFEKL
jgi:hypothetical protein